MPTVSVIIPSYNHEKYVTECIQSVLDQTFQDFEIVITDDGSADHTVETIERFKDPRIRLFRFQKNRGACVAANNCLRHASGKYIAMLSSDDVWYPQKLAVQVEFLDANPAIAAVFGKVDWIDESGSLITDSKFPYTAVFDVENRTRFEWLRYFVQRGNCLCHPCSLVRRECYSELGMFDPAFASIPDFDLWIRICLKHEIMILDQKLIRFRRIGEESNASGDNIKSRNRNRIEYKLVLNHYLKISDPKELLLIFPEAAGYGSLSPDLIPYFLGRVAIDTNTDFMALWGLDVIYTLLEDEKKALKLEEQCSFTYRDFIKLAQETNVYNLASLEQKDAIIQKQDAQLSAIYASREWQFALFLRRIRVWLLPPGSWRERQVRLGVRALRKIWPRVS